MINFLKKENTFKILCFLYLIEVFIGGAGTILSYKGISLRMILFSVLLAVSVINLLLTKKLKNGSLILFFLLLNIIAIFFGILDNAEIKKIFLDIKPLLSFFIIIPLSQVLTQEDIPVLTKSIKKSGLLLGILYLICVIIMRFELVPFSVFYSFFSNLGNTEVFFRGNKAFFYKGFLYLNISFIFYFLEKRKISLILFLAILLTDTRGFLLALVLTFFSSYLMNLSKQKIIKTYLIGIPILAIVTNKLFTHNDKARISGDGERVQQIIEVLERVDYKSIIFGHGYGIGVPVREIHMEITYMEIFHKQGIIGIAFYIGLLIFIIYSYDKIKEEEERKKIKPYILGVLFVYFQSLTNPFLINPIGITFVVLSVLVLKNYNLKQFIYVAENHKKNLSID